MWCQFIKIDKQFIKSYWPVPLLPICGKIFGKIACSSLNKFLDYNCLFNPNQPGAHPVDSCINNFGGSMAIINIYIYIKNFDKQEKIN